MMIHAGEQCIERRDWLGHTRFVPSEVRHVRAIVDTAGLEWLAIVGPGLRPVRFAAATLAACPELRRDVLRFLRAVEPERFSSAATRLVAELTAHGDAAVHLEHSRVTTWW